MKLRAAMKKELQKYDQKLKMKEYLVPPFRKDGQTDLRGIIRQVCLKTATTFAIYTNDVAHIRCDAQMRCFAGLLSHIVSVSHLLTLFIQIEELFGRLSVYRASVARKMLSGFDECLSLRLLAAGGKKKKK